MAAGRAATAGPAPDGRLRVAFYGDSLGYNAETELRSLLEPACAFTYRAAEGCRRRVLAPVDPAPGHRPDPADVLVIELGTADLDHLDDDVHHVHHVHVDDVDDHRDVDHDRPAVVHDVDVLYGSRRLTVGAGTRSAPGPRCATAGPPTIIGTMGRRRGALVRVLTAALVLSACASDRGDGTVETTTTGGGATAAPPAESCFWSDAVTAEANNTQYPDQGAAYWFSGYTLPQGATLALRGVYPHARYASFNAYGPDPETGVDGVPVDVLADVGLAPDEGSTNPFVVGADRAAPRRAYAVTVVAEAPPGDEGEREPGVLYGGSTDQQLIYRVYVPDDGRDLMGDAGLPQVEVELADGTVLTGDEACAALDVTTTIDTEGLPSLDQATYRSLVALGDPATHPAFDPVEWHAFFNTRHALLSTFYAHTDREAALVDVDATKVGGFYSNADNAYVVAAVNRLLGPDPDGHNLLVLTGTAPSTPATQDGEATMADGDLRYWSLCQNESPVTTRVSGCLYDEQVPVDDEGRYTIVLGLPEDRPDNATEDCGVAWLDWGPGDGVSRPEAGTLLLRNMLPSADFDQAVQRIERPGDEAAALGPHLPTGTYVTPDDLATEGCPAA